MPSPGSRTDQAQTSALRHQGQAPAVWVLDPGSRTVQLPTVQIATADATMWVATVLTLLTLPARYAAWFRGSPITR